MENESEEFVPDVVIVDRWECPDENGPAILTMPNVPKPTHTLAPRTILGSGTWNHMRKACYANAHNRCEACGRDLSKEENGKFIGHAHELYSVDYAKQEVHFERCVCLCGWPCHLGCIHTGRALTMYKHKNPLYTKEKLLEGAEYCFTIISSFNREHPDREPLRVFSAWLDYIKQPELEKPMIELIKKYDIKFYKVNEKKWYKPRYWSNWKLKVGNRWYPTPFADFADWRDKMEQINVSQESDDRNYKSSFTGKVYDDLDKFLSE